MDVCLRVLKESNKSRFDSYSRQKQCIDHIPYFLSRLSRAHFSDNLSRNSCIQKNTRKNYQLLENGGECQDLLTRDVESCLGLKIDSEPTSNL